MHSLTKTLAAVVLAAVMSHSAFAENLKLGFLVKQPEGPWFQTEWKFADKAGKALGFEVIEIAVPDGEKPSAPSAAWRRTVHLYAGSEAWLGHHGACARL